MRLAGAAYLVYLGVQTLLAAWRGRIRGRSRAGDGTPALAPRVAARQGLVSNLGTEDGRFFPSLLPQFVPPESRVVAALLVLGLLFCAMTLVWLTAYATRRRASTGLPPAHRRQARPRGGDRNGSWSRRTREARGRALRAAGYR